MKKITIMLMLLLAIATASATTIDMDAASGPGTGFDNQYIYEYDYNNADVEVTFSEINNDFVAHIEATGLKPYMTYQLKFEGKGSLSSDPDEVMTNEMIGLNGRWWYNGNRDDTYYFANKDTYNIVGYMVFDWLTADENGEWVGDVSVKGSYHVLFCDDAALTNSDLYDVSGMDPYSSLDLKCDGSTALKTAKLCPELSVNPQVERAGVTGLPEGIYENVVLVLNEESFHQDCGTWTTAMTKDISFVIDHEFVPNVCGNGVIESGEECDDSNTDDFDGCSSDCVVEDITNSLMSDEEVIGSVSYPECTSGLFYGKIDTESITTGIKRHQLKIEGMPTCKYGDDGDDWANEQLGLEGRFWCTDNCPCTINPTWGGCNIDDNSVYLAHKDDPGFCATGYILFDCVNSDESGEVHSDFTVDSSYATCTSYLGEAELPEGEYQAKFLLGQDYSPWATAGIQELEFQIGDCDYDGIADDADNCPGVYNPGQEDLDDDGIGSACDDEELYCLDEDGDGYLAYDAVSCQEGNDCNDDNPDSWRIGVFYVDMDSDGYHMFGPANFNQDDMLAICYGEEIPKGFSETTLGRDCDDDDGSVNPEAKEVCDKIDNNCDGEIDEGDVCGQDEVPSFIDLTAPDGCMPKPYTQHYGWAYAFDDGAYGNLDESEFCLVWESPCEEEDREAGLQIYVPSDDAVLTIRHLDGISDLDSFEIYLGETYIGRYDDVKDGVETWVETSFDLADMKGVHELIFIAVDDAWSSCDLWNQVAIDWVEAAPKPSGDVPEFTLIGALAVLGIAGLFVMSKRH